MRAAEHQVTAHVTAAERADFEAYARKFHLDAAGLLALLFAREMRVARLHDLIQKDVAPHDSRKTKVTFRVEPETHAAIGAFAQAIGMPVSQVGAAIVRTELRERWLEQACDSIRVAQ